MRFEIKKKKKTAKAQREHVYVLTEVVARTKNISRLFTKAFISVYTRI